MHDSSNAAIDLAGRADAARAGRRLEYFTLGWNLVEAAVAVGAGLLAGSIALIGFGADSVIESVSGGVLLWRLQTHAADGRRERLALKLVGWSFLLLAVYIGVDAVKTLMQREAPQPSWLGNRAFNCLARRDAAASPGQTPGRGAPGKPGVTRRLEADGSLRLAVRHPAWRTDPQRAGRLVVGRSGGRAPHGSAHRARRCRGVAGRGVRVRSLEAIR